MYCTCPQIFYPRNSKDCSKLQVFTSKVENRVDPDELASEKPADQYLHCFLKGIYNVSRFSILSVQPSK